MQGQNRDRDLCVAQGWLLKIGIGIVLVASGNRGLCVAQISLPFAALLLILCCCISYFSSQQYAVGQQKFQTENQGAEHDGEISASPRKKK